jgi:hypothetical protein
MLNRLRDVFSSFQKHKLLPLRGLYKIIPQSVGQAVSLSIRSKKVIYLVFEGIASGLHE